jgi:hypothetical protein
LRNALADTEVLADIAAGATATLTSEIARLERACELLRRRLLPTEAAVTRSKQPRRAAATNGLDKIALELQPAGLLSIDIGFPPASVPERHPYEFSPQPRMVSRFFHDWELLFVESVENRLSFAVCRLK